MRGGGCRKSRSSFLPSRRRRRAPARRSRPGGEVAHVARRHAERVRHQDGEVARALAVQDAGHRGRQEAVRPVVESEHRSHVQQLGERPRMEGERHFDRHGLDPSSAAGPEPARRHAGHRPGRRPTALAERTTPRDGVPAQSKLGEPGHVMRPRVAGWTLAAVSRWANGLRSLPTPIRPSAHAWTGSCRGRRTDPGRRHRAASSGR